jgi:ribosome-binding protein aMBF1 (putative translation factor)
MFALAKSTIDRLFYSAEVAPAPASVFSLNEWIGNHVRVKRMSRGLSPKELCNVLCIDQSTLIAFEAGEKRISADLLMSFAKVLEVPVGYFFQGYVGE